MHGDAEPVAVAEPARLSVAFISSYGGLGGSEVYLERLLTWIDRPSVGRIVLLGEGALAERLRLLDYPIDIIPTLGSAHSLLASSWRLRRLLRTRRPDVLHANGLKATIVAVLATVATKAPVIWVRHDFSLEGWRARALALMCRRVVCVSGSLASTFRGRSERKTTVVYTGIPPMDVDREEAHHHFVEVIADEEAQPIISLVGQLVPGKGHRELIEITTELAARLPHARITFVGGLPSPKFVPYLEGLKAAVEERGAGDIITFVGHRDDAVALIAGSDIAAMPSMSSHEGIETEGFPLLALEAMAVGTPVVGYRVGGLSEAVADCGSLVDPGDRRSLLEAIIRLAADPALSRKASECGRERARHRFPMATMLDGLQRAYRQAARG